MIGMIIGMLLIAPVITITAQQKDESFIMILQSPLDQNVTISDFQFTPSNITVPVGTKVIWTNNGPSEHTVTSDTNIFNSGTIPVGGKWNHTFNQAGSYPYHCSIHPIMHGVVNVVGGGNLPPNKPTIDGPTSVKVGVSTSYTAVTTDPEGDNIQYYFDWGDGTNTGWLPAVTSGTISHQNHTWSTKGSYVISAKARDTSLAESPTATLSITVPVEKSGSYFSPHMIFFWLLAKLVNSFPQIENFIQYISHL